MPLPYAYCRALNPATGDVLFDATRSSWKWGHPAAEIAVRALRTDKGAAQRDPEYGLDLDGIDLGLPGAAAQVERRVRACLDRYVKLAIMKVGTVLVEIHGANVWVALEISDPRDTSGMPVQFKAKIR